MEIREGYQKTEVGVIPIDWEVKSIEELTPKGKKYNIVDGPFGSNLKTIHYRKSGVPIITSGYVTDGKFSANDYLYVDLEKFKQEKRSAVNGGDIVMAKIGERCGACAILPKTHEQGILSGNALKITIDENKHESILIQQIFWSLHQNGDFELLKTTGAQPAISMANLKKFRIPLPSSKNEQTAIATALSDADALINSLEKLIAKKRNIKQGAMQQLLKPKEGWEVKKLGEICDIRKGEQLNRSTLNENDHYPVFNGGVLPSGYTGEWNQNENTIIISEGGNSCGFVNFVRTKFWQGGHCYSLNTKLDKEYFYQMLKAREKEIMALRVGSGLPNIQRNRLYDFFISIPLQEEQTRIATILSDMDAEIQALETKLEKYRKIKLGMMQNLLTGKIRLI